MYFELAWQLGCTVEELLDRISSAELTEWVAVLNLRHMEQELAAERARAHR